MRLVSLPRRKTGCVPTPWSLMRPIWVLAKSWTSGHVVQRHSKQIATRRAGNRDRESIHNSRCSDSVSLILFALIFFRRHNAVMNCVGMKHYRDEVKEKETDPESGGRDGGQKHENPYWNSASHPQKAYQSVSFVNMPYPGNDTKDNCDGIA